MIFVTSHQFWKDMLSFSTMLKIRRDVISYELFCILEPMVFKTIETFMAGNVARVFENNMSLQYKSKTGIAMPNIHGKTSLMGLFHKACHVKNSMIRFEKTTPCEKPRSAFPKTCHNITRHIACKPRGVYPKPPMREITHSMQNQKYNTCSAVIYAPIKEIKRQK